MASSQMSDQDLPSWTTALAYATLLLVIAFIAKAVAWRSSRRDIPPCPARPYPVVGHLLHLRGKWREKMLAWTKTGEIYSIYFGPKLVVVINSFEAAYEAFVKNAEFLSDRKRNPNSKFNAGILNTSGQLWKEQRTTSLQILRSFGMGKNILSLKISEEITIFIEELARLGGKPKDVRMLTNTAVSNIICSIIVGKRFEFNDPYFLKFLEMLSAQVRVASNTSMFSNFRWLKYLPGDLFHAKKRINGMNHILTYFCRPNIEQAEKDYDENNLENFISAYLFEMKKMEEQGKETTLNHQNLAANLAHLFAAGTETTSTTILWFMLYMLHYPEIQQKVFAEIKEVVGTERAPSMQDRTQLNFTNAAISETQRLASIVPLGLPHLCTKDTIVKGYTIPEGTTVLVNFDAILWSSQTWENPLEFRPERFLDTEGNYISPAEQVPFSLGRRVCLGEALARMELFLFLTSLIQRFELLPSTPELLPPRAAFDGITSPPKAFELRFLDRLEI